MKRISRNIALENASDLLTHVPRACITFTTEAGLQAQPVALIWHDQRYFIGIAATAMQPAAAQEVVLLVDQGVYFFDLRAVYIRGTVHPAMPPDASTSLSWWEVLPTKTVAWDYGTLHEEETDEAG